MVMHGLLKFLLLLLAAAPLAPLKAQSDPWPSGIEAMPIGRAASPHRLPPVDRPRDSLPSEGLSDDLSRWAGTWSGYMCRQRACDTQLQVRNPTPHGADVRFTWVNEGLIRNGQGPFTLSSSARFEGGDLVAKYGDRQGFVHMRFRHRSSGALEVMVERTSGGGATLQLWGVLTHDRLASWPQGIEREQPAVLRAQVAAVVPDRPQPLPSGGPSPSRDPVWSGRWSGTMCVGRVCEIEVEIVRTDPGQCEIGWAVGTAADAPTRLRSEGMWSDCRDEGSAIVVEDVNDQGRVRLRLR
jgi:hypothetical protein